MGHVCSLNFALQNSGTSIAKRCCKTLLGSGKAFSNQHLIESTRAAGMQPNPTAGCCFCAWIHPRVHLERLRSSPHDTFIALPPPFSHLYCNGNTRVATLGYTKQVVWTFKMYKNSKIYKNVKFAKWKTGRTVCEVFQYSIFLFINWDKNTYFFSMSLTTSIYFWIGLGIVDEHRSWLDGELLVSPDV